MKYFLFFIMPVRFVKVMFYKMRFRSFGWRSMICSPLHLAGCSNIIIGNRVNIGYKTWLQALPLTGAEECRLELRDRVVIGHFNHIISTRRVILEENVLTADKVYISDNLHGFENVDMPIRDQPIMQHREVVIGAGSWLGEHVCILGARIGRHCVIGANSVVTHDIPDYCVAVGAPARIIKRYNPVTNNWERTSPDGNFLPRIV